MSSPETEILLVVHCGGGGDRHFPPFYILGILILTLGLSNRIVESMKMIDLDFGLDK